MKILAVDTTSHGCSVAVVADDSILSECHLQKRETHSKHLMSTIDSVLQDSGLTIYEIDGFAVAKGPGSFTGLRIGISTVKGLAAATGKPVTGVSSLEALAYGVPVCDEKICTIIDARKQEVYSSSFRYVDGRIVRLAEEVAVSPLTLAESLDETTLFVGTGVDAYKKDLIDGGGEKAVFSSQISNCINAVNVALIGRRELSDQCGNRLQDLVPNYIRKSDAEMNLKRTSY